jgi:flagellar hook-associated protein 3 FlgL
MALRVTQQTIVSNTLRMLQERLAAVGETQARLASGKRIQRPSDDAGAVNRALRLRDSLAAVDQGTRNIDDGLMWVGFADQQLQSVVARLQRARELGLQAASTLGSAEREAIAAEIVGIREDIVTVANARSQGRPLFAGYASGDAVGRVGGTWTYLGDGGVTTRRIGDGASVPINVTGDDVFGFSSGSDVFSILDTLEAQVLAGDTAGVASSLDAIDGALGRVLDGLAALGTAGNRLEVAQGRLANDAISIEAHISQVEDVDLPGTIMELQLQQVAYQAALGAMQSAIQPSLIDFLR